MKKLTAAILVLTMLAASCMTAFSASFSDVGDEFAWASEAIDKFSEENIIVGKSDGVFAPDDNVTRAEFAKLLVLTFKLKSDKSAEYSDVAKDFWGYEYINAAYGYTVEANVLDNTCANDVFMPDNTATRQEIAAAIAKHNKAESETVTKSALRITILLALPCGFGLFVLAKPVLMFLYQNGMAETLLQKPVFFRKHHESSSLFSSSVNKTTLAVRKPSPSNTVPSGS